MMSMITLYTNRFSERPTKVKNPLTNSSDILSYEGPLKTFDFDSEFHRQYSQLKLIQDSLKVYNLELTVAYISKSSISNHIKRNVLIGTSCGKFWWRLHENNTKGSMQNLVYVMGKKRPTSEWLENTRYVGGTTFRDMMMKLYS